MSKRHLEADTDSSSSYSMNRKSTFVHKGGILNYCCEEDRMENFSGGRWRKSRLSCSSSPGSGSVKRPRPVSLKPFDFSLINGEPSAIDSRNPCSESSQETKMDQPSSGDVAVSESSPAVAFNAPPSMILPFLFLGSQNDALSKEFITSNGITHILNASTSCTKSPYIANENFLRIPVNDSHTERLLPHFENVKKFLDGCCKANGRVLVHCLAGISRSPTLVIAYVMSHLRLSQDDAYRYVKRRRSSISPNFNFLGQLMEFESMLRSSHAVHSLACKSDVAFRYVPPKNLEFRSAANSRTSFGPKVCLATLAQSPTTAFARLSFDKSSPSAEEKSGYQELNEVTKRSKPASGDGAVALNDDNSDSGLCPTFPNASNPENTVSNQRPVYFQLNESGRGPQNGQQVTGSLSAKPVFTEHCLRKVCSTEVKECIKRTSPPVRPNSIAISGLQFDFGVPRKGVLPPEINRMIFTDADVCKSPMSSLGVLSCVTEACKKLHADYSRDLLRQVESACRSSSFNDIPTVAASASTSNGSAVLNDVRSSAIESAKASSGACVDRAWHRALEGRASNSSLSSVSSSSVHGSRELVQVS